MSSARLRYLALLMAVICVVWALCGHAAVHIDPSVTHGEKAEDVGPLSYTPETAWFALHLSKAAYCAAEDVLDWSCGPTCEELGDVEVFSVYDNESWDSMALVGVHHATSRIVVAFRGTRSITNWLSNLSFWPMTYPNLECRGNCSVHRGFYHTYQSFLPGLLLDVAMLQVFFPSYTCFISGHSLGAALAVFAALDMSTLWALFSLQGSAAPVPPPLELYTFGEPRVGNDHFSVWATRTLRSARQQRLTHNRDPVPRVPPSSWGYIHVPRELWFSNDTEPTTYKVCNDSASAEDLECGLSVWATSVSDHLSYLGTCTRCTCTAAEMEEIRRLTLPPHILAAVTDEYLEANKRHTS